MAEDTAWETIESIGNAPTERWGHTATKISNDRVVAYGGIDDEERTLGDLHVFDMQTHRWTTPINCETIPRTWHDAVHLPLKNVVLVFGASARKAVMVSLPFFPTLWYWTPSASCGFHRPFVGHLRRQEVATLALLLGTRSWCLVVEQDGIGGARYTFWTLVSKK